MEEVLFIQKIFNNQQFVTGYCLDPATAYSNTVYQWFKPTLFF